MTFIVKCHPVLEDQMVVQDQHRLVCLTRPYQTCQFCPHQSFTLLFNANSGLALAEIVSCPRWEGAIRGAPDYYVPTEVATCRDRPFSFCSSCPSSNEVAEFGADKREQGWFGRWSKNKAEEIANANTG